MILVVCATPGVEVIRLIQTTRETTRQGHAEA